LFFAKYPVTNAQYSRFLEAEDFHAEKYWIKFPKYLEPDKDGVSQRKDDWGDEGYKWLKENLDERKKIYPRYWNNAQFGANRRNAPVVGITWYEANAYCRWLMEHGELPEYERLSVVSGRLSAWEFRLPTEHEWELAASPSPVGRGQGE
jgi:formylglycine-generating enzyme required for sulfatase activity